MEKPFIIDSNFFIQAYRINYPFDVVPSFWVKVLRESSIVTFLPLMSMWSMAKAELVEAVSKAVMINFFICNFPLYY